MSAPPGTIIVFIVGLVFMAFSFYSLGHYNGYNRREEDEIEERGWPR